MKFQIESKDLVEAKDRIKKVILNSSLVKKSIYLKVTDKLIMYAQSEGNYGEIHVPCEVLEEGFVELLGESFDAFNFIQGVITFTLDGNQLKYKGEKVKGKINIIADKPDFKEADKPIQWVKLPKVVFGILYCITKDDLNLRNVFFVEDKIATTSRIAFAGYKHPTKLTDLDFTVAPSVFDIIPKDDDFEVAFDLRKIWFKSGEFYLGASTVDYKNQIVSQYGYYEFEGDYPYFEITIEEAKRLCGYTQSLSNNGYAALLLKDNQLIVIPSGNEIGQGSIEFECRSSQGEMNFGTNTRTLLSAVSSVDAATCKVYKVNPQEMNCLLVVGHLTRHLFTEVPSARYNEN